MIETGFEQFWNAYPRKREKLRARTAYDKALKHSPHEEIMAGVRRYASEVVGKVEPRFVKHPATWLNAGCWMDYDPVSVAAVALNAPRVYKCQECLQISIGTSCGYCQRMTA